MKRSTQALLISSTLLALVAHGQAQPVAEPESLATPEPTEVPEATKASDPTVAPEAAEAPSPAAAAKPATVAKPAAVAKSVEATEPLEDGPIIELPEDGPLIELPSEEGDGEAAESGKEVVGRTDKFSSIGEKTASIVNRTVLGGYAESPLTVPFNGDSYFESRRLIVFLYSQLHPRITFSTEIEFEFGGTPKKQNGQLGFGEVILEYAAVDFRIVDMLTLRTGIVLVPFGKFNINHDSPTRDLTDRPLVIRTVIPSTWFEAGAGGFGSHQFGSWKFGWEGYAINGLDSRIFDGLGNRGARGSLIQDNNNDKALVGRVGLEFSNKIAGIPFRVEVGSSYYDGAYDRAGARARIVGSDLTLRLGKFEFLGEVVRQFNEPGFDDDFATSSRRAVPEDLWGFYVQANYHFFPEFLREMLPADLQESTLTASLRYDLVDTDMAHININDRDIMVAGLNYRPIEAFVFKNEIQRRDSKRSRREYFYVSSVAYLY